MISREHNLIYGIGSANGDDQLGWRVIEKIRGHLPNYWHVKSGLVPMDLLNHLEGIEELHIIDACESEEDVGTVYRLEWPKDQIQNNPVSTSHDFSLSMTLELATSLGILPKHVIVWGIVGRLFGPSDSHSLSERDFTKVVETICQGICLKGNVRA